jgi:hypothetical protein
MAQRRRSEVVVELMKVFLRENLFPAGRKGDSCGNFSQLGGGESADLPIEIIFANFILIHCGVIAQNE